MEDFYKELQERQKYLESLEQTDLVKAQLHELLLCTVRVQQILLANLPKDKYADFVKPDFEKLALEATQYCKEGNHDHDCSCAAFEEGCELIWKKYVVHLQDRIEVYKEFHNEISEAHNNMIRERDVIIDDLEEKLSYYADKNQNQ